MVQGQVSLDDLDYRIIAELLRDGRASFRKIAEKIGVSVSTIVSRVEALEKNGVIKGYMAIIDPAKIGYTLSAVIHVRIRHGKLLEVQKSIASYPNVYGVYDVTGESDSVILARFRDREELSTFVKTLLANEHVERTITYIVLDTIKEEWRPTQLLEKIIKEEK
ncbi:MAG: Lrp/AsnC family transcriptional regulator [Thaumarchaeota archaeon]|jgi:DNA-binding Lrp family transcriptional regulator|nr:Lrp/AsnC family transcriptional regulator [Candidatus Geocrenenecus arthurdayi]MCL7391652.1 Lrp/AsnC family transcriptional regulator [Candidatus Geocrenenecus arthurdayi]MCL7397204.1 Lrp/AsnC family transcriptional regulator [Candidatus Geocrenenecus arthurdayi]MCL7402612.1 Lrp/AsnC family transcriptional regulator [Candidatus Geocrenenecus arthurdayi]MCL7404224.1 Lrp/AsnC family transcriptional regulator [Candidatus Geocrenenecus arthurdayi]